MEKHQSFREPANAERVKQNIQGEVDGYETVCSYLNQLEQKYGKSSFAQRVYDYAENVDPTDSALGKDEELPRGMAFYDGCLLGMRVAEEILGEDFILKLDSEKYHFKNMGEYQEGSQEEADEIARQVLSFGEEGYNLSHEYLGMVERLEDEISEVQYILFVRLGFGFLMYNVSSIEEKAYQEDMSAFRQEVETMEHTPEEQTSEKWETWLLGLTNSSKE